MGATSALDAVKLLLNGAKVGVGATSALHLLQLELQEVFILLYCEQPTVQQAPSPTVQGFGLQAKRLESCEYDPT